jgi:hypothetical protein
MLQHGFASLGTRTQQDIHGGITAIIEDHVGWLTIRPVKGLVNKGPVFFEGFALMGKNRNTGISNRGGGMILGGENIA